MAWMAGWVLAFFCWTSGAWLAPSRHLTVAGATGSLAYLRRVAADFEKTYPPNTVALSGGGSIAGLVEVSLGRVDIGISDVAPQREWTRGVDLSSLALGRIPLLIIAHPGVGVSSLSPATLRALYSGQVTSWAQVGGRATPVVVMTRPLSSGARQVLQMRLLGTRAMSRAAVVTLSNGAMLAAVQETPGAIGFVESGVAPARVALMGVGLTQFHSQDGAAWPYAVTPTAYWKKSSSVWVRLLAEFLANRPYRRAFGLYPTAS